jgi:hypothetical protein
MEHEVLYSFYKSQLPVTIVSDSMRFFKLVLIVSSHFEEAQNMYVWRQTRQILKHPNSSPVRTMPLYCECSRIIIVGRGVNCLPIKENLEIIVFFGHLFLKDTAFM